jgi:hypothetical protein
VRDTHKLSHAEGETSQNIKKMPASEQSVLTNYRERQVRTGKESGRGRGTHSLSTTETSHDVERKRVSEGHSHTAEQRER